MTNVIRPIKEIAKDIKADWRNMYFGARPYVSAMTELDKINDQYYSENARGIVLYFLANAQTWRGEVAKRIKTELKELLKVS